jgi:cytosine/adenosine deaminase-related metal-dependent hydrolase
MDFKKFTATSIFNGFEFLTTDQVIVTDVKGTIQDVVSLSEAGDGVEHYEGILSPGFINCHCHLELSHMKGVIPEHTGMGVFVESIMKQRQTTPEFATAAIEKAEEEMLESGIVAVGDICNSASTIPQKIKGRIWYHNFIEATGFNPAIANDRFKRCVDYFTAFAQLYSIPIESNSIVPHAPYSVSNELWQKIIHFPGNHLFTIHNQESAAETEWFLSKTGEFESLFARLGMDVSAFEPPGQSSLRSYLPKFLQNQSLILVHNTVTTEEDLEFANATNLKKYWCICPNANLYITGQLPALDLFIRNDCRIVLGTDSLASNHHLSILSEIRTIRKHFPQIEVDQLLRWATTNGAQALQMEQLLGSFEKGKRPGLLLLEDDLSSVRRLL